LAVLTHLAIEQMPDSNLPRQFLTTRWSLVLSAGQAITQESQAALATLCELYWYPVYAFIRRTGHTADDSADLTQAFFARLLEKHFLKDVRPDRGRFRSFLLASVRHFLSNERDWQAAGKRGGGLVHFPLEFDFGERRYQLEPSDGLTPDRVYDRRWALGVFTTAMNRLAERHSSSDRRNLFLRLQPFLTGDASSAPAAIAAELGMSDGALRVTLHRLRRQFGEVLKATIAETVASQDEVEDELRYLMEVLSDQSDLHRPL
jgi:RNA polymerase sigma-70 factor (ECF subfamily)